MHRHARDAEPRRHRRLSSNATTAAAAATFSDSTPPAIGIDTQSWIHARAPGVTPAVSLPSTIAVLPPENYPAEGQRFFHDYAAAYDDGSPDPYAIYGYEAMSLTLDAIERAAAEGKVDKAAVAEQLFATEDRASALGTYSIDEDGDTTLTDYGSYAIKGGQLVFDETIKAQAG